MSLPESAVLGRLVRDARPRPRETFTAALDARVAAGFPREKKRRRRLPSLPKPRVLYPALGLAATAIVALVLATSLLGGGAGSGTPSDIRPADHALVEPAPTTPQGESVGAAGPRRRRRAAAQGGAVGHARPRDQRARPRPRRRRRGPRHRRLGRLRRLLAGRRRGDRRHRALRPARADGPSRRHPGRPVPARARALALAVDRRRHRRRRVGARAAERRPGRAPGPAAGARARPDVDPGRGHPGPAAPGPHRDRERPQRPPRAGPAHRLLLGLGDW